MRALIADLDAEADDIDELIVLDNRGDLELDDSRHRIVRPTTKLRWIGSVNWGLSRAAADGFDLLLVLNSDIRLSMPFVGPMRDSITSNDRVAIAGPCYDDFWPHQRASCIPSQPHLYDPVAAVRNTAFCDGTAWAIDVRASTDIGLLDDETFLWHGYGADLDYSIRARKRGYRVIVTEACYISHLRRASMSAAGQSEERANQEIENGMTSKYGPEWRRLLGLTDAACRSVCGFESRRNWYLPLSSVSPEYATEPNNPQ